MSVFKTYSSKQFYEVGIIIYFTDEETKAQRCWECAQSHIVVKYQNKLCLTCFTKHGIWKELWQGKGSQVKLVWRVNKIKSLFLPKGFSKPLTSC